MRRPCTSAALLTLGALMTVALLASPTDVSAAQPPETHVQYRSSDLATDRGVRALYWRIVYAARMVCAQRTRASSGSSPKAKSVKGYRARCSEVRQSAACDPVCTRGSLSGSQAAKPTTS